MPAAARSRVTTRNLLEPCLRAPVVHRLFVAAQPLRRISLPPSLDMPWGKAQSGPAAAIHTAVSSALTRTRLECTSTRVWARSAVTAGLLDGRDRPDAVSK